MVCCQIEPGPPCAVSKSLAALASSQGSQHSWTEHTWPRSTTGFARRSLSSARDFESWKILEFHLHDLDPWCHDVHNTLCTAPRQYHSLARTVLPRPPSLPIPMLPSGQPGMLKTSLQSPCKTWQISDSNRRIEESSCPMRRPQAPPSQLPTPHERQVDSPGLPLRGSSEARLRSPAQASSGEGLRPFA